MPLVPKPANKYSPTTFAAGVIAIAACAWVAAVKVVSRRPVTISGTGNPNSCASSYACSKVGSRSVVDSR